MDGQVKKPVCIESFLLLIRYIYVYHVYRNETRRVIFFLYYHVRRDTIDERLQLGIPWMPTNQSSTFAIEHQRG